MKRTYHSKDDAQLPWHHHHRMMRAQFWCAVFLAIFGHTTCAASNALHHHRPLPNLSRANHERSNVIPAEFDKEMTDQQRQLQMIIVRPPDDADGDGDYDYNFIDSQSENSGVRRATTAIICNRVDAPVARTDLNFDYKAELNDPALDFPSTFVEQDLPPLIDGASVESVAGLLCDIEKTRRKLSNALPATDAGNGNSVRSRQLQELEKIASCIVSVSTGNADRATGFCDPSSGDRSCFENQGDIRIIHTEDCDSEELEAAGMTALRASMNTGPYLTSINSRITEGPTEVVHVSILERESPRLVAGVSDGYQEPQDRNLSGAAIFFVIFAIVLLIALLIFLCCWRHRVNAEQRKLADDLRSIKTDWSGDNGGGGDKDFLPADFHNLSLRPSNVDVHKCSSGVCAVCHPTIGREVVMFPVGPNSGRGPMTVSDRAESLDEMETFDDEMEEEPYDQRGHSPRRIPSPPGRATSPTYSNSHSNSTDDDRVSFLRVENPRRLTDWNNYEPDNNKSMVL